MYNSMVSSMDRAVGRILDALEDISPSGIVVPYFIIVISCGSFFVVNYMLAEICLVFTVKLQVPGATTPDACFLSSRDGRAALQ